MRPRSDNIAISELRKYLSYDADTGVLTWLVSSGRVKAGAIAGTHHCNGYRAVGVKGKKYLVHRIIWALHHGKWPKDMLDHEDTNKAHNAVVNLREANAQQNHANKPPPVTNTSGVKGVYWYKPYGKWKAQLKVAGKTVGSGYFDDKQDAIAARTEMELKYQGAFRFGPTRRGATKIHNHRGQH